MQDVSTQQSCRRQCPHDARCTLSRHLGQPSRRSTRYADVEANHSGATAEVTENEHLIFPSGHARARSTSNQRNGHIAGVELSKCPRHLAAGSVSLLLCGRKAASVFRGSNMRTEVAGQAEVFRAGSRSSERYSPGRLLRRLSGDSRQRALVSQSDWLFVARSLQIVHLFVEDYAVPGSRWLVRAGADIGGIKQGHGQTRRDDSTEFNPNCSECNPLRQTWQSRGRKELGVFQPAALATKDDGGSVPSRSVRHLPHWVVRGNMSAPKPVSEYTSSRGPVVPCPCLRRSCWRGQLLRLTAAQSRSGNPAVSIVWRSETRCAGMMHNIASSSPAVLTADLALSPRVPCKLC